MSPKLSSVGYWLTQDAIDDYFPDPVGFQDLADSAAPLSARPLEAGVEAQRVPKNALFQRLVLPIPPDLRLTYTAATKTLLDRLGAEIHPSCLAYSARQAQKKYPFSGGVKRWLGFNAAFREALVDTNGWGVVTDVTAYFDNIKTGILLNKIREHAHGDAEQSAVKSLGRCFDWLGKYISGIPQNNDASSFLGNFFLTSIDRSADSIKGRYFRYADDIRLVVKSRADAIDGFTAIQDALRSVGLHLNSAKTVLLQPGTPEWEEYADGERDRTLGIIDDLLLDRSLFAIDKALELIESGLRSAEKLRDVRAFSNRALRIQNLVGTRPSLQSELDRRAIAGFFAQPEGSDLWGKILSTAQPQGKIESIIALLTSKDSNRNAWTNCCAISWLGKAGVGSGLVVDQLQATARNESKSYWERATSMNALGSLGVYDSIDAKSLLAAYPNIQMGRMLAFAFRDAPPPVRDAVWEVVRPISPLVSSIVDFCASSSHLKPRQEDLDVQVEQRTGFGKVQGRRVFFRLPSGGGADYE